MLKDYNLYYHINDGHKLETLEELKRYVRLEIPGFIGKDEIEDKLKEVKNIEELENILEELNRALKSSKTVQNSGCKRVEFFLISKEDDGE